MAVVARTFWSVPVLMGKPDWFGVTRMASFRMPPRLTASGSEGTEVPVSVLPGAVAPGSVLAGSLLPPEEAAG